ncbi:toprim domain-containing protein [Salegentibacter salegens]|uniref:CHC2 zinc finger n=1 Tax=Salegentibacter salegens TaxID=143223 RepID=A0A1M7K9B1_9FLAO|nr:toprim domain-containing protein [Salegentibacter salegens]PRX44400.1 CHC2-type zinc finger protein [Salegentibacter salegens]SHM61771.1 CHC2 zinc finger [Salegentibacter salegens]
MNLNNLSCKSARNICIVKTLAKLGHFPTRTTEKEAWFLSPLRSETQASFSVSLIKNLWFDFGLGRGGNTIDLIMLMKSWSVREVLEYLKNDLESFSFSPPKTEHLLKQAEIRILDVEFIYLQGLIDYLKSRNIPFEIGRKYCRQVWYGCKGKRFFAIGLENHKGGWELRNKYFKTSSSPKTYSLIERESKHLLITEGMFDFLSLATIDEDLVERSDCLILNSLAFLNRIKMLLPNYDKVSLYLDNDLAGKKAADSLLRLFDNITDWSNSYNGYKDLNEKLTSGKSSGK